MPYTYQNRPNTNPGGGSDNGDLISWILVVAGLVFFWPVGLVLLFLKLTGRSFTAGNKSQQGGHPYDTRQDRTAGTAGDFRYQGGRGASAGQGTQAGRSGGSSPYQYRYKFEYSTRQTAQPQQSQPQRPQQAQPQQRPQQQRPQQRQGTVQPGMQGVPYQRRRKTVDLNKGKGMTVWGGILLGLFGFVAAIAFPTAVLEEGMVVALASMTPIFGFAGLGAVLLGCGVQRRKKAKRFRKYLALIGSRDSISIATLAQAMPVSYHTACDDLQEMLDEGYIPTGYLDMGSGRLILSADGLREEAPEPERAEPEEEPGRTVEDDDAILREIRQVNDSIADPEMSRKIDRIGEITGKILDYQRKNPDKSSQMRSFLSYYLPTTLKILKAYSQMEAQGIEGENITAAKGRIEGMMDKIVEGFEKQLDKFFQDDAMDITTDVEVLERMLEKDGLSGGAEGFQMGI